MSPTSLSLSLSSLSLYIYIYNTILQYCSNVSLSLSLSMADPPAGSVTSDTRRRGAGKRATTPVDDADPVVTPPTAPCGACKFLRRRCVSGCIFAPHFGSDQGSARFAAVHKVFGASNVSKLLMHIPVSRRQDAVVTISYEAQSRLSDPVYGCVSTILALQQQVASLQAELAMVQNQLMNSRLAVANAMQSSQQQQQQMTVLQPAFSNNSSASNTLVNMSNFNSSFDLTAETAPSGHNFEPHQLSKRCQDDEDEEEESQNLVAFANQMLHPR
ncbi:LOB domain-containing protein 20-like [Diospyros lotus]|uniref:LOB domain-containing protein 20-like n=1 Tax=Diospyros lotus TaxID=55363 RepID=UPI0022549DAC|nr:LOB domain-containing protein 20-like [Diospyros lotus]